MGACAAGATVKTGVDGTASMLVDRWLWEQATGSASSWLDPILDLFTPSFIKVSDLCALNLDDPPLPSVDTIIAALARDPFSIATVMTWLRQKLEYWAFSQNCTCTASTAPACVANYLNEATTPSVTGVSNDSPSRLWIATIEPPNTPTYTVWGIDLYMPEATTIQVGWTRLISGFPQHIDAFTSSVGWHTYQFSSPLVLTAGELDSVWWRKTPSTAAGDESYYTTSPPNPWPSAGFTFSYKVSSWSDTTGLGTSFGGLPAFQPIVCQQNPFGVPPPAVVQPPQPPTLILPPSWTCGTTADLCARLQQVEQKINTIVNAVTLIQRQNAPFAYLRQASFPVSGQGSHAVQGILGVSLALADSRTGVSNYPDNPTSYFDLGWISFGTADGMQNAVEIRRRSDLFLGVSPAVTVVSWSLPSGVSGTCTPLVREAP